VQFQVVSELQGLADSELYHMTEDITSAISDSRSVSETNGSQGSKYNHNKKTLSINAMKK